MQHYEYSVIPAPDRGSRAKGGKTPTDRYATALAEALNRMAADGWDYLRAETLPSDERNGIASRQTVWHNLLVFRRALPPTGATSTATETVAEAAIPAAETTVEPAAANDTPPLRRSPDAEPASTGPRLGPAAR